MSIARAQTQLIDHCSKDSAPVTVIVESITTSLRFYSFAIDNRTTPISHPRFAPRIIANFRSIGPIHAYVKTIIAN